MPTIDSVSFFIVEEAAFVLALLGSIDSLLTSLVADNMTRTRHNSNKELVGQGIGNLFAGMFGGAPGAGATMRTVVNIRSGGKTRISGMLHALLLLAIVLGLGPYASYIPNSVLAGILVKVGLDIIDWSYIKNAHRGPRWDLALMAIVVILTIFVDLITAVGVGVVLASLAFVKQVANDQMEILRDVHSVRHSASSREIEILDILGDKVQVFDFGGPLSFGAAADLGHHARSQLERRRTCHHHGFRASSKAGRLGSSGSETVARDAKQSGRNIFLCSMNENVEGTLSALEADKHLDNTDHFKTREEALGSGLESAWHSKWMSCSHLIEITGEKKPVLFSTGFFMLGNY